MRVLRHASTLLLLHVAGGRLLGRVHLVLVVHTVLVALIGFGRVQTGLRHIVLVLRLRLCIRAPCATVCSTYLDQVLALCLCNEWLELGRGKRIHQTSL